MFEGQQWARDSDGERTAESVGRGGVAALATARMRESTRTRAAEDGVHPATSGLARGSSSGKAPGQGGKRREPAIEGSTAG